VKKCPGLEKAQREGVDQRSTGVVGEPLGTGIWEEPRGRKKREMGWKLSHNWGGGAYDPAQKPAL